MYLLLLHEVIYSPGTTAMELRKDMIVHKD
jgi:hypothetical protein